MRKLLLVMLAVVSACGKAPSNQGADPKVSDDAIMEMAPSTIDLSIIGGTLSGSIANSASSIDFGDIYVGSKAAKRITISAKTNIPSLDVSGFATSQGFVLKNSTCKQSLAAKRSCVVDIEYSPTQAGASSKIVAINSSLNFELKGHAMPIPTIVYNDNAQVYADGRPGVADAAQRPGWYYQNTVAGQKINWYFYDGINQANVSLANFSAYAVMTFDAVVPSASPILAVYTVPAGSGDIIPGFARSRVVYSAMSPTPVVGTKYLVYFGQNPTIHPSLPRIQLGVSTGASAGPRLATERVLTASFGSNSAAVLNGVKYMVESLGVNSPSFKASADLRIRVTEVAQTPATLRISNNVDLGDFTGLRKIGRITVSNLDKSPAAVTIYDTSMPAGFSYVSYCPVAPAMLASKKVCQIEVAYMSSVKETSDVSKMASVTVNAKEVEFSVVHKGEALQESSSFAWSTNPLNLGTVSSPRKQMIYVSNTSNSDLSGLSFNSLPAGVSVSRSSCSSKLKSKRRCFVELNFNPSLMPNGSFNFTYAYSNNDMVANLPISATIVGGISAVPSNLYLSYTNYNLFANTSSLAGLTAASFAEDNYTLSPLKFLTTSYNYWGDTINRIEHIRWFPVNGSRCEVMLRDTMGGGYIISISEEENAPFKSYTKAGCREVAAKLYRTSSALVREVPSIDGSGAFFSIAP